MNYAYGKCAPKWPVFDALQSLYNVLGSLSEGSHKSTAAIYIHLHPLQGVASYLQKVYMYPSVHVSICR